MYDKGMIGDIHYDPTDVDAEGITFTPAGTIEATDVQAAIEEVALEAGGATHQDYIGSPMIVTGGEITEGTAAGTFKVAALTALLRKTDSDTGELDYVAKTEEDNIAITLADTNYYIILNYNAGSPTISLITDTQAFNDEIPLGSVMKTASDEVFIISGCYRLQNGVAKLHYRAFEIYHLYLTSGNTIAYSGINNFTMNAGVVYEGINRLTQDAYDSAVTQFKAVYRNGTGGWTEVDRNTIDFNHYDDGDGTLGNISPNQYSCHWVYRRSGDGAVYVLYGRDSYTLAEAEVAKIPALQPDYFTNFGCLIGRIVAPVAGGSFASIAMATDTVFAATAVATHNELGGLNADDYKHLTAAEYAAAILNRAIPGIIGATTSAKGHFTELECANNNWLAGKNFAGSDVVNMLKVNVDDEIDVGGTLVLGAALEAAEDSGAVTLTDMPVSATPAAGNEMSFTQKIDGTNILKVYAEADSSGGIQNPSVRPAAPVIFDQAPQVLTGAGAVDLTSAITHIVTTGADALTLADGVEGQVKFIIMKTDGGDGTLTPANYANGTTLTFNDVGDSVHLMFTNGSWHCMGGKATSA